MILLNQPRLPHGDVFFFSSLKLVVGTFQRQLILHYSCLAYFYRHNKMLLDSASYLITGLCYLHSQLHRSGVHCVQQKGLMPLFSASGLWSYHFTHLYMNPRLTIHFVIFFSKLVGTKISLTNWRSTRKCIPRICVICFLHPNRSRPE